MKLFGGGGSRRDRPTPSKQAGRPAAPASGAQRAAPKPPGKKSGKTKPKLTKKQKQKRIIIAVGVVAVLCAAVATAAFIFIRPPEIKNDPTIKDPENGDKVDINSLLNAGTRIDDVFTFFVGAVDEDQTRTDALMVVTMDVKKKTVNVMNIPRDTMCNNSYSGASRKINAAYGTKKGGNTNQTKKEIERLMGFQPDNYVVVNFDGIAEIVDAIGGVDYEIPFRMEYDDPSQNLHIDLYAGMQHLDGKQVVEFLRWRHNNNYTMQYEKGDEGRVETQQKFLKYLAGQVLTMENVLNGNVRKAADAVFKNVKTDFTAGELIWMGMQAVQIKSDNIQFHTLPGYGAMSYAGSDPYEYSFFFPYYNETLKLVNQYFNPYQEEITTLDIVGGPETRNSGGSGAADGEEVTWGDSATPTPSEPDDPEQGGSGGSTPGGGTDTPDVPDPGTGGEGSGGDTGGGEDPGSGGETGGGEEPGSGGDTGGDTGGGSGGEGSGGQTPIDPEA